MRHIQLHASDFPNYTVSCDGEVTNNKGQVLKGTITNNGYKIVSLSYKNKKHKTFWCS